MLPNTHTRALCLAQAPSWCKSAMLSAHTVSHAPRALSQLGRWLKLPLTSHCLSQAGRLAIQCAIYHTDRSDSKHCVFDAGAARQAGPWGIISSLWNNARADPGPLSGQANLVPENPNNAANLQRKIKQRGFCFLSSSPLLSPGEDPGFVRSPGYSFHAGAEP